MKPAQAAFPRFRPVAEHAVLAEFGDVLTDEANKCVNHLDAALAATGFDGFIEAVPGYVSLLVAFDPIVTDHDRVAQVLSTLLSVTAVPGLAPQTHEVLISYDDDLSPDLDQVARHTGMTKDAVVASHLSGDYRVLMYGFAPGYAYLTGLPDNLHLPRKPSAKRAVPAGSVIIAGGQCLVTTLTMPTGWWIIGRSPTPILRPDPSRPFLFDVGDHVRFRRIGLADFNALSKG